jgi:hypothetical protein
MADVRTWPTSLLVFFALALSACSSGGSALAPTERARPQAELEPTYAAMIATQRDSSIPELPFPDNRDPDQCGIPIPWGEGGTAYLTGFYQAQLVAREVILYDSHLRLQIAASAPHGSKVRVLLYQQNPETDYYLVKVEGASAPNEGWVPGPFLSFEPVAPLDS